MTLDEGRLTMVPAMTHPTIPETSQGVRIPDILRISLSPAMPITTLQKWGNSQGLRFSKALLAEAGVAVGDSFDVSVHEGRIVLTPSRRVRGGHDLRELVRHLPKGTRPKGSRPKPTRSTEVDWGVALGQEEW